MSIVSCEQDLRSGMVYQSKGRRFLPSNNLEIKKGLVLTKGNIFHIFHRFFKFLLFFLMPSLKYFLENCLFQACCSYPGD